MSKLVPYLAFFAGLVMCAIVVPGAIDELSIANDFDSFSRVRAKVISERPKQHNRGPATGHVEFEFTTPDGRAFKGDNALTSLSDSPERVDKLTERIKGVTWIDVYYDPEDPSRVVIHEVNIWWPIGLIAMSLLLVVGGIHASIIDKRRRRLQDRADAARRRGGRSSTNRDNETG